MNPVQTDFLNIADIRTACHTAGDPNGKPLLLLHGGGVDHALLSWQEVMQLWPENGYRLIAPDLPGYGQSAVPDKDSDIKTDEPPMPMGGGMGMM